MESQRVRTSRWASPRRGIAIGLPLVVLATLALCCTRPLVPAEGGNKEIVVLTAPEVWSRIEAPLSDALERTVVVLEPEHVFLVERADTATFFEEGAKRRNVLLVVPRGAGGVLGSALRKAAPADMPESLEEPAIFVERNVWVRNQAVISLVAQDTDRLPAAVTQLADSLYRVVTREVEERVHKTLYLRGYKKQWAERFAADYGWSIHVPSGFQLRDEEPARGFVSIIQHYPERQLFVHWGRIALDDEIAPRQCLEVRARLAATFYEGDSTDVEGAEWSEERFLGREALLLKGRWNNERQMIGGPFWTYCFRGRGGERLYMIDLVVFAPGGEKYPPLRQLKVIAETFEEQ